MKQKYTLYTKLTSEDQPKFGYMMNTNKLKLFSRKQLTSALYYFINCNVWTSSNIIIKSMDKIKI